MYHQSLESVPSASDLRVRARDLCIPLETRRFLSSADRFQGVQVWFGERTQRSGRVGRKIPITSSGVTLSITNMISRHVCMYVCMYMSHFALRFGECPQSHLLCFCVSLSRLHSRGDSRQRVSRTAPRLTNHPIIPFPPRKSRPAQAPTTSGPCFRVEMLIRDAAPMRTITKIRTARTMGRVFIFASSPSTALTWFVDPHLRRF